MTEDRAEYVIDAKPAMTDVKISLIGDGYYIWRSKRLEARIAELERKLLYAQQKCKRYQRAWMELKGKKET